jgi:hypothetical protein
MELTDQIANVEIERVRKYALAHRFDLEKVKAITQGVDGSTSNPLFIMNLPDKVCIRYTIEEHPGGWFNHVAVSIGGKRPQDPVAMALACLVARPLSVKRIDNKGEVCVYTSPDGNERHILLPFVDPDVDKIVIAT